MCDTHTSRLHVRYLHVSYDVWHDILGTYTIVTVRGRCFITPENAISGSKCVPRCANVSTIWTLNHVRLRRKFSVYAHGIRHGWGFLSLSAEQTQFSRWAREQPLWGCKCKSVVILKFTLCSNVECEGLTIKTTPSWICALLPKVSELSI